MGVDNLGNKMKSTTEVFGAIHSKVAEYKTVQEKISKDYEENIREKVPLSCWKYLLTVQ